MRRDVSLSHEIVTIVKDGRAESDGLMRVGDVIRVVDGTPLERTMKLGEVLRPGAQSFEFTVHRRDPQLAAQLAALDMPPLGIYRVLKVRQSRCQPPTKCMLFTGHCLPHCSVFRTRPVMAKQWSPPIPGGPRQQARCSLLAAVPSGASSSWLGGLGH